MHPMFYLLFVLLAYVVYRSVKHYLAKRWPFLVATLFVVAVLSYEIVMQLSEFFSTKG